MPTSRLLRMVVIVFLVVLLFATATPLTFAASCTSPYIVREGETWRYITLIVFPCGVSYSDLRAANPDVGEDLAAGDVLILPGVPTSTPTASPTNTPTPTRQTRRPRRHASPDGHTVTNPTTCGTRSGYNFALAHRDALAPLTCQM